MNLSIQFGFVATFVAGKVALVQVSAYRCFTLPVIIAPMLNTHVHLHVALTRGANGQSLGTFQNANAFGNREALDRKQLSLTLSMVTFKTHFSCYFKDRPIYNK